MGAVAPSFTSWAFTDRTRQSGPKERGNSIPPGTDTPFLPGSWSFPSDDPLAVCFMLVEVEETYRWELASSATWSPT